MDWQTSVQFLGSLVFILSWAGEIVGSTVPQQPRQSHSQQYVSFKFTPTEDKGISREGGVLHGGYDCFDKHWQTPPMKALLPPNSLVTTVAAHPNLYVYIAELGTARLAELRVFDEADNEIYRSMFTVPGTAGIHKLTIPKTLSLETGKNYQWYVHVLCNSDEYDSNPSAQGLLRRVELSQELKTKLEQEKNPLQQAKSYAGASIWNETLNMAVQLRRQYPTQWEELLKSVKLEEYSQKPVVECCTME